MEVINSLFEKYKNDQTLQINPRESTIEELESEYKQSIQSDFHKKTPPRVFKSGYNPVSVSNNEESILNDLSKFRQFAMNEINQSQ